MPNANCIKIYGNVCGIFERCEYFCKLTTSEIIRQSLCRDINLNLWQCCFGLDEESCLDWIACLHFQFRLQVTVLLWKIFFWNTFINEDQHTHSTKKGQKLYGLKQQVPLRNGGKHSRASLKPRYFDSRSSNSILKDRQYGWGCVWRFRRSVRLIVFHFSLETK